VCVQCLIEALWAALQMLEAASVGLQIFHVSDSLDGGQRPPPVGLSFGTQYFQQVPYLTDGSEGLSPSPINCSGRNQNHFLIIVDPEYLIAYLHKMDFLIGEGIVIVLSQQF
jgi:hypothetical protein